MDANGDMLGVTTQCGLIDDICAGGTIFKMSMGGTP